MFFRHITIGVFGLDDAGTKSILIYLFLLIEIIYLGKTSTVKVIEGGKN